MNELCRRFPQTVRLDVPLAPYSWWQIGGTADAFADVSDENELTSLLQYLKSREIPWCLIGRGTNLLFDDAGFRGCVIRIGERFSQLKIQGNTLSAQAGCWTPYVTVAAARAGLSGMEHAIGIPASFGGLICMNGGSQRKGVGDLVSSVRVLQPDGTICDMDSEAADFSYRNSRFQHSGEIVLGATLQFTAHRAYSEQRPELLAILRERSRKFPRKLPSCGSVFKSSPELFAAYGPPGKVIEDTGFKGKRRGNIEVSPRHANFIVNLGSGSSADVLSLVNEIRETVREKTGLTIDPEFRYLDPVRGILEV